MSWVRRVSPGDPAYFCDCPPCPFCFEWVDDGNPSPRRKKRKHAKPQETPTARERPTARRLVLPVLAGVAFALTVGLTMRHQNLSLGSIAPALRSSVVTRPVVPSHVAPPPATAQRATPAPAPPPAPSRSSEPPAPPANPEAAAAAGPDPARQEAIPVRVAVKSADSGFTVSLRNWTQAPLDLKVTAVDPSSGSQSMVAVNIPGQTTVDLTRAGLVAEHGYQLTLESPGYVTRELMLQ